MRVLQDALKHMMGNLHSIPVDLVSEGFGEGVKPLPTSKLSGPLFFWYDYFSCPQMDDEWSRGVLLDAINSIPAYVDECSFFLALVPVLEHPNHVLTPSSWHHRGWCRLERTCRELSKDHSWIMVKSPTEIELITSATASMLAASGPVGEGLFSVEEDRLKLGPVLRIVLKHKLLSLLKSQNWPGYRALLNQQAMMLRGMDCDFFSPEVPEGLGQDGQGQIDPSPSRVAGFLHQNGFSRIWESDGGGCLPLHYAALKGDPWLVQDLLALQADPNQGTKRFHPDLGLERGVSALAIACQFKNNQVVKVLISARARFTCRVLASQPLHLAAAVNNQEAVEILCSAGCSPLSPNAMGFAPMHNAAAYSAVEVMDELIKHAGSSVYFDVTAALHVACDAEMVHRLVQMTADVNGQTDCWKRSTLTRAMCMMMVLQHRFYKVTQLSQMLYHSEGASPLIMALVCGQYEAAAALIAAGAELTSRNARGLTPKKFIQENWVPECLQDALEGRLESCQRVALLARGWVEMKF